MRIVLFQIRRFHDSTRKTMVPAAAVSFVTGPAHQIQDRRTLCCTLPKSESQYEKIIGNTDLHRSHNLRNRITCKARVTKNMLQTIEEMKTLKTIHDKFTKLIFTSLFPKFKPWLWRFLTGGDVNEAEEPPPNGDKPVELPEDLT